MPSLHTIIFTGSFAVLVTSAPADLVIAQENNGTRQRLTVELVLPPKSEEPASLLSRLEGIAKNNLAQNLLVILVTALVTGLAVPRVKANMDLRYFREQKKHEAELARQAKLIDQQTEFLKKFINVLWRFHFAMVKATYARANNATEEEFKSIWDEYGKESWAILQECRRIISVSVYLVTDDRFKKLLDLYKTLVTKDVHLVYKVEGGQGMSHSEWRDFHHELFFYFSEELDNEIASLAREMGLRAGAPSGVPSTNSLKAEV